MVGGDTPDCYCQRHLEEALEKENEPLEVLIPRGWFLVGKKHDVPKNACFVGHYCDTYVWVMPDGVANLSRFTLTALELIDSGTSKETLPPPRKAEHGTEEAQHPLRHL
jgi:hypothetical protein